eukprot:gene3328-5767_t
MIVALALATSQIKQPLTTFTTNFLYFTKITNIQGQYKDCVLKVNSSDSKGKPIGQQLSVPISYMDQRGIILQNELEFKLVKDSTATHIKIALYQKGSLTDQEIASAFFGVSSFSEDTLIPFDLNLLQNNFAIGKISLKIYIPGKQFENKSTRRYAAKCKTNLCQIHFTKGSAINTRYNFDVIKFNNDISSIINKVMDFVDDNQQNLTLYQITSIFNGDFPMVSITIQFKDSFVQEALSDEELLKTPVQELFIIPSTVPHFGYVSKLGDKGLQSKLFMDSANTSLNTFGHPLSFHVQNEIKATHFVEINKENMNVVSVDKEIVFNINNFYAKTPYVSCFIVWYYLKKNEKVEVVEGRVLRGVQQINDIEIKK